MEYFPFVVGDFTNISEMDTLSTTISGSYKVVSHVGLEPTLVVVESGASVWQPLKPLRHTCSVSRCIIKGLCNLDSCLILLVHVPV